MDVQAALGGHIQHPLRQDQAIRRHHHHVGTRIPQRLAGRRGIFGVFAIQAQAQRLLHTNAVLQGTLLDRGGLQFHATARRAVWLGQHQRYCKTCLQQTFQGYTRKLGRARKNNSHGFHPRERLPLAGQ